MTSTSDIQVASVAAGFTLGFGFLTVWKAIQHTMRNRRPWKSPYIYMIWGEIIANLCLGLIGWFFLNDQLGPEIPVLFFFIFFWVFEIQLLMQIIINRIAIIAENEDTVVKLKWGTAGVITCINIAVFCIWIPSHTNPPVSELYVRINEIWDRISKILILIVDAGLNYYFLRTVKERLVKQHGLRKYAPLVTFNARLMVVSILMDAMLIGLMSLPNQDVYIQFHPVTYMVKLNIEMTMADLIMKLAKTENSDMSMPSSSRRRTETREEDEEDEDTNGPQNYKMQPVLNTKATGEEDFSSIDDDMGQFDESKAASTRGILDGGIQVETTISSQISRNSRVGRGQNDGSDDELALSYPVR